MLFFSSLLITISRILFVTFSLSLPDVLSPTMDINVEEEHQMFIFNTEMGEGGSISEFCLNIYDHD